MKYGRNQATNDLVKVSTSGNGKTVAIAAIILVSIHRTEPFSNSGERLINVMHA